MRVGHGFDAHRFGGSSALVLGGIVVPDAPGVEATSDGDVVAHAIIDAMLGAAALGDLGTFYPSADPRWHGVSSVDVLLADARGRIADEGWIVASVDCTVIAQSIRVEPIRTEMRHRLSEALGVDMRALSVKATTTDGLGPFGAGEGLAASAVVVLVDAS